MFHSHKIKLLFHSYQYKKSLRTEGCLLLTNRQFKNNYISDTLQHIDLTVSTLLYFENYGATGEKIIKRKLLGQSLQQNQRAHQAGKSCLSALNDLVSTAKYTLAFYDEKPEYC